MNPEKDFAERMFNLDARVERLIWIPGSLQGDSYPDLFEEFCDDLPEKEDAAIYTQLPALAQFAKAGDTPEQEEVADAIRDVPGFLFQAATPVIRPIKGMDTAYECSWGQYHTAWMYAKSDAEIVDLVEWWVALAHVLDRAKASP